MCGTKKRLNSVVSVTGKRETAADREINVP